MAVETTNAHSGPYAANGATTAFPFTFSAMSGDDVTVIRRDSDGVETTVSSSDYSVALTGAAPSPGTVTFGTAPASGYNILLLLDPDFTQETEFENGSSWLASPVNNANDRAALRDQVLKRDVGRTIKTPVGEVGLSLPSVADRAGKLLAFNEDGSAAVFEGDAPGTAGNTTYTRGAITISAQVKMAEHLGWAEFGIVGDGTTDDTSALTTAITAAVAQRATLHLPPAIKTGAQTVSGPCTIEGPGGKTLLTAKPGTYDLFTIADSDVTIRNLYADSAAKSGGVDFTLPVGTGQIHRTRIENIISFNSFGFFADSGSTTGYHATTILKDIQARVLRGPGVAMTRLLAFGEWDEVLMEYFASAAPNYTAFSVDGSGIVSDAVGGLKVKGCTASGTSGTVGTTSGQKGFSFNSFSDIEFNALADTLGGDAYSFTTVNKLQISTARAALCDGHGFTLTGVTNSVLTNLLGAGRNGQVTKAANQDGLRFVSGCYNIAIGSALMRDFTGHGVDKVAAQAGAIDIANLQAQGNTGRGVKTVGDSVFTVGGGTLSGNAAGNYDLGGAHDRLFSMVLNSGGAGDFGPGPVSA